MRPIRCQSRCVSQHVTAIRQAESSFSGLWRRFSDRVYARSWHGLWTSLLLKVLHFNLEQAGLVSQPADSTRD